MRGVAGPMSIEDLELDAPRADEVRIAVEATAICQSDLSFLDGHWATGLPVVLGHETVGVVADTGADVGTVVAGDRVVVSLVRSCGSCRACRTGQSVRCTGIEDRPSPLASRADGGPVARGMDVGGFATQVVVHQSQVVTVPDDLPTGAAVLLGCGVVTGVGAVVNRAQVEPGSSVVVVGCGGVGIHSVQAARERGAAVIVAVDPDPVKRDRALELGATVAADPGTQDVAAVVSEATGEDLADVVLVTVGSPSATEAAFDLLGGGGTMVLVGMLPDDRRVSVDTTTVASMNQQVLGSKMGSTTLAEDIPRLVELYRRGDLVLDGLVSSHHPLERIDDALAAARRSDTARVVVTMGERTGTPTRGGTR